MDTDLSSPVELFISCRGLKNLDTFSKSDPIVKLKIQNEKTKQWLPSGETERVKDNLNPDFQNSINVRYFFEKHQVLRFDVLDDDGKNAFETVGYAQMSMGDIMGSRAQTKVVDLKSNDGNINRGRIIIRAESLKSSNIECHWRLQGENLANKAGLPCCPTLNSVHFNIERSGANNQWGSTFSSEKVLGTDKPLFRQNILSLTKIANGDENKQFRIVMMCEANRIG